MEKFRELVRKIPKAGRCTIVDLDLSLRSLLDGLKSQERMAGKEDFPLARKTSNKLEELIERKQQLGRMWE